MVDNENIDDIYMVSEWELPLDCLVDRFMLGENKKLCQIYINFKTGRLLELDFDKNYAIFEASLKKDVAGLIGLILICPKKKSKSKAKFVHSVFKWVICSELRRD